MMPEQPDTNAPPPWSEELRRVMANIEAALVELREAGEWIQSNVVAHDVLPVQVPEPIGTNLRRMHNHLENAQSAADSAFRRYSSDPVERLFTRQPLTREQYFLLQAMGVPAEQLPPTGDLQDDGGRSTEPGRGE